MKVKEIPVSIFHSIRLSFRSVKHLKEPNASALPVIISLTSIPSRLHTLHLVVRSILDQQTKPEKIILWLNQTLQHNIPKKLKQLEGSIFEIRFSDLHCSHRKLIHTLSCFPHHTIVTCDDDLLYRRDWLNILYSTHLKQPNAIVAHQTRHIRYNENNELLPYKNWNYPEKENFNPKAVLPIGAGGILYPANTLDKRVTDVTLFMKLAPKADDLWFKAMALLLDSRAIQTKNPPKYPIPIIGSQTYSLKRDNIKGDKNRVQWNALTKHFHINISSNK